MKYIGYFNNGCFSITDKDFIDIIDAFNELKEKYKSAPLYCDTYDEQKGPSRIWNQYRNEWVSGVIAEINYIDGSKTSLEIKLSSYLENDWVRYLVISHYICNANIITGNCVVAGYQFPLHKLKEAHDTFLSLIQLKKYKGTVYSLADIKQLGYQQQ